ncbi:hypothetical protein BGZ82_002813, partial [Podila clonocystis]
HNGLPSQQQPSSATSSTSDLRISPIPTRSNSGNSQRAQVLRQPSHKSNDSMDMSPVIGPRGTTPVLSDLRRMGSNTSHYDKNGLQREDSVRSNTSGGSPGGGMYQQGNGPSYLDEPVYAGLRDKLRVKCHYTDTRAVLVRVDTPIQELLQRVQEKFQADRPLKLKYKDEDHHMLSMVDDEDWLMAQQVHLEATGSLDRMELWCFEDD